MAWINYNSVDEFLAFNGLGDNPPYVAASDNPDYDRALSHIWELCELLRDGMGLDCALLALILADLVDWYTVGEDGADVPGLLRDEPDRAL